MKTHVSFTAKGGDSWTIPVREAVLWYDNKQFTYHVIYRSFQLRVSKKTYEELWDELNGESSEVRDEDRDQHSR